MGGLLALIMYPKWIIPPPAFARQFQGSLPEIAILYILTLAEEFQEIRQPRWELMFVLLTPIIPPTRPAQLLQEVILPGD
jgi:hypothetical protein